MLNATQKHITNIWIIGKYRDPLALNGQRGHVITKKKMKIIIKALRKT